MARVTLRNVSKVYPGGVTAVDGLTLEAADEQFVVLVGPSGCGKSTTLRLIAGLEEPSSGTIEIGERVVNDVQPKDRDIAMVFQNYALYPHMTVWKNMAFSLLLRRRELGLSRADIDRKVRETARMLGIEDVLDRRPRALSGGQRQRVAVGRAIVRDPKAFLFDEPLSNVDAQLRTDMRTEIKNLHRRLRTTTLYVTHDQEEAMTLGDVIAVMKDGRLQQVGPPLEVYQRPVNRFVASFVGTPAMNFLNGRVVTDRGAPEFDEGSCRIPFRGPASEAAARLAGEPMVLGIRPTAIGLMPVGGRDVRAGVLNARIDLVEPQGEWLDVHATTAGRNRVVARVGAGAPVSEGQAVCLVPDSSRTHLFEPGPLGRNVSRSEDGAMTRVA